MIIPTPPDLPNTVARQELLKKIGAKVRLLRKAHSKNYQSFAETKGLSKVVLFAVETGRGYSMKSFLSVLIALDISVKDFFSDIE